MTILESKLVEFFEFINFVQIVSFESVQLSLAMSLHSLPSGKYNVFISKLVKMWSGGTLDVMVDTLKISLDWFIIINVLARKEFII